MEQARRDTVKILIRLGNSQVHVTFVARWDRRASHCLDPKEQEVRSKAVQAPGPQAPGFGALRGTPYVQPGMVAQRVALRTRGKAGTGVTGVNVTRMTSPAQSMVYRGGTGR